MRKRYVARDRHSETSYRAFHEEHLWQRNGRPILTGSRSMIFENNLFSFRSRDYETVLRT